MSKYISRRKQQCPQVQQIDIFRKNLKINQKEIWTQILGEFNAYNLIAVFATARLLGEDEFLCLKAISKLKNVPGRFQTYNTKNGITLIIDYAHTPDALKNVLNTINKAIQHAHT